MGEVSTPSEIFQGLEGRTCTSSRAYDCDETVTTINPFDCIGSIVTILLF